MPKGSDQCQPPDGAPCSTKCPLKKRRKRTRIRIRIRIRPESRGPQGALRGLILIFKGRIIYILTNFVKKIFPKRNFPKLSFLIKVWLGNSEISLEMLKLGKLVLEFSFYEISSQMILPWTLFEPKIHLPKIELFADFRDLWQGRLLSLQTYKTWHICKSLYYCLLHIEAAMNKSEQRESLKKGNAM